jgi:hypothetical protein
MNVLSNNNLSIFIDDTSTDQHPQMSAFPQNQAYEVHYQQPAGILHGPGYKLVNAQTQVSKCSWYIKIVAWIFIIYGATQSFVHFIKLFDDDGLEIEFDDAPVEDDEIELPGALIAFATFLTVGTNMMTVLIGFLILKTIKDPTRQATWSLFKNTAFILAVKFILTFIIYVCIFAAFGAAFDEWFQQEDVRPGDYKFKHKKTGHELKVNKPHHPPQQNDEESDDIEIMEGISLIVFSFIFASLALTCCVSAVCASCLLGGLYKYHTTAKELDIIQDLPSVRQVNMQQFAPQHQVQPQMMASDGTNIARGHVVMMPQIQNQ